MEPSPKRGADPLSEEGLHPTYAVSSSSDTRTTDEVDKKLRLDLERYRALCESERRFRITFEATPVGVSHIGLDGKLLLVNQGFCDLVGYTHEELYERTFVDITYAEDRIADIAYVQRALAGERQPYVREKRPTRCATRCSWEEASNKERDGTSGQTCLLLIEKRMAFLLPIQNTRCRLMSKKSFGQRH